MNERNAPIVEGRYDSARGYVILDGSDDGIGSVAVKGNLFEMLHRANVDSPLVHISGLEGSFYLRPYHEVSKKVVNRLV